MVLFIDKLYKRFQIRFSDGVNQRNDGEFNENRLADGNARFLFRSGDEYRNGQVTNIEEFRQNSMHPIRFRFSELM